MSLKKLLHSDNNNVLGLEHIFSFPKTLGLQLPKVSIIVTNYNYGKYIIQCLESIAGQTYSNWECIIVDDCSKDNSVQIISEYINSSDDHKKKFLLLQNPHNVGQMKAIETGLKKSDGEFIVSIDSDDLIYSDFIATHIHCHLNSEIPYAFSCSNQIQIDDKNHIIASNYNRFINLRDITCVKPAELFGTWEWTTLGGAMFRRPVLELICPDDDCATFRICADLYLFYVANLLGGSIVIPDYLGCYRRHRSNNFSTNGIITGLAFPGDMRKEPDKEQTREIALKIIEKRYNEFLSHYTKAGLGLIIYMIISKSTKYHAFKKQFAHLLPTDIEVPNPSLEHEKEFLYKIYHSALGRFAYLCLKGFVQSMYWFISIIKPSKKI